MFKQIKVVCSEIRVGEIVVNSPYEDQVLAEALWQATLLGCGQMGSTLMGPLQN